MTAFLFFLGFTLSNPFKKKTEEHKMTQAETKRETVIDALRHAETNFQSSITPPTSELSDPGEIVSF